VTNQAGWGSYNAISLGAVNIGLVDGHTSYYSNRVAEGYFTAVLQSGNVNPPLTYGAAAIAQTGFLPAGTRSLLFDLSGSGGYASSFFLAVNGSNVPFFSLETGPNFIKYGADISTFAGQTVEIRFTAQPSLSNPWTTVFLDDIQFSPVA